MSVIETARTAVLYPFMESGFNDKTAAFIETVSWIRDSRRVDVLVTVDKAGQTSRLLKKARLPYEEVGFSRPLTAGDWYFPALFKLMRSALPSFFYFKAYKVGLVHCPDLTSLLCWGNTAKMNRVRFIASLTAAERVSHFASLMLADAAKLVCANEDVRQKMPPRFSSAALLAPEAQNIVENMQADTRRKNAVDFWTDLYASLCAKPDPAKMTGLLNKN